MLEGDRIQVIAASSSGVLAQAGSGKVGDFLGHIVIHPENTSGGSVVISDGSSGSVITAMVSAALSDVSPRHVVLNAISRSGAWKVVTGANLHVTANGDF